MDAETGFLEGRAFKKAQARAARLRPYQQTLLSTMGFLPDMAAGAMRDRLQDERVASEAAQRKTAITERKADFDLSMGQRLAESGLQKRAADMAYKDNAEAVGIAKLGLGVNALGGLYNAVKPDPYLKMLRRWTEMYAPGDVGTNPSGNSGL